MNANIYEFAVVFIHLSFTKIRFILYIKFIIIPPMQITILGLLLVSILSADLPPQTPIIGIFTQTHSNTTTSKSSYIAASYVKFIEMSGAQVIPLFSFSETDELLKVLGKINGVLFPGGGMQFDMSNQWTKNADTILNYAKQQNEKANPFPIFGTCLGFQLLSYLTAGHNSSVISRVHGDEATILPLNVTEPSSYLFQTFSPYQMQKTTKGHGIFYFNHNFAVVMDTFQKNRNLKDFWILTAISTSNQNQRFVSAVEAKNYPFYGTQFHAQKNLFEWKVYADRSLEGVETVQILSNRFVQIARKSKNRFDSAEQFYKMSIYNYKTQSTTMSFTQIYVFDEKPRVDLSVQE